MQTSPPNTSKINPSKVRCSGKKKAVLISILNWNGSKKTIKCIESLIAYNKAESYNYEIFVIDNGSQAEDRQTISEFCHSKHLQFLSLPRNIGFTGGHNISLQKTLTEGYHYCYLLNNDCLFVEETIEPLIQPFDRDEKIAATSTQFAYEDTRKIYFSGAIQNWQALSPKWATQSKKEEFIRINKERVWAVATGLMIKAKTIRSIGMLEEQLFAYCEDDDYGHRIVEMGLRTEMIDRPVVLHGPTPEPSNLRHPYFYYLTARNHTRFYLKYTPKEFRRLIRLRLFLQSAHRAKLLREKGAIAQSNATQAGCIDGLTGIFGPPREDSVLPQKWRALFSTADFINSIHTTIKSRLN